MVLKDFFLGIISIMHEVRVIWTLTAIRRTNILRAAFDAWSGASISASLVVLPMDDGGDEYDDSDEYTFDSDSIDSDDLPTWAALDAYMQARSQGNV